VKPFVTIPPKHIAIITVAGLAMWIVGIGVVWWVAT